MIFTLNLKSYDISMGWQLLFQDPATPIMEGIIGFHHDLMFLLLFIVFFVFYILFEILILFTNFIRSQSLNKTNHQTFLEIFWTVIPSLVLFFVATPSFALLYSIETLIHPTLDVKVIGHQWYWTYEYSNHNLKDTPDFKLEAYMLNDSDLVDGHYRLLTTNKALILPTHLHIGLYVTSADVLHSWAIPSLGIKVDACPGRLNHVNLFINREGTFYGQCSEICGVNHGFMPIMIKGVSLTEYCDKLNDLVLASKALANPTEQAITTALDIKNLRIKHLNSQKYIEFIETWWGGKAPRWLYLTDSDRFHFKPSSWGEKLMDAEIRDDMRRYILQQKIEQQAAFVKKHNLTQSRILAALHRMFPFGIPSSYEGLHLEFPPDPEPIISVRATRIPKPCELLGLPQVEDSFADRAVVTIIDKKDVALAGQYYSDLLKFSSEEDFYSITAALESAVKNIEQKSIVVEEVSDLSREFADKSIEVSIVDPESQLSHANKPPIGEKFSNFRAIQCEDSFTSIKEPRIDPPLFDVYNPYKWVRNEKELMDTLTYKNTITVKESQPTTPITSSSSFKDFGEGLDSDSDNSTDFSKSKLNSLWDEKKIS
jgi:cytochrome c oxidase subunit 2